MRTGAPASLLSLFIASRTMEKIIHQFRFLFIILMFAVDVWILAPYLYVPRASLRRPLPQISIVYFASIRPNHPWEDLIRSQMTDLNELGLSRRARVFVSLSAGDDELLRNGTEVIHSVIPRAHVATNVGNQFEYPGIHRLWTIGKLAPYHRHIILYFHSKGMWNPPVAGIARSVVNYQLTNAVIVPWRRIIRMFDDDHELNKVGWIAAPGGWMWYNFFWVRASYLYSLEEPKQPGGDVDRYYYEHWLGFKEDGSWALNEDGFTLCPGNRFQVKGYTRDYMDVVEACED